MEDNDERSWLAYDSRSLICCLSYKVSYCTSLEVLLPSKGAYGRSGGAQNEDILLL